MKYPLYGCFLLTLFSCAPTKEQRCQKIDDSIRKSLERLSEKEQKELTIDDLHTFDYELIGEGRIDSLKQKKYTQLIALYSKAYVATLAAQDLKKAQSNLDSANYYMKLDSLTSLQITNRYKDPKTFYYTKTFVKMTYGTIHTHDTVQYALDKFYKLVPLL